MATKFHEIKAVSKKRSTLATLICMLAFPTQIYAHGADGTYSWLITGLLSELDHVLIFTGCFLSLFLIFKRSLNVVSTFGAFSGACVFIFFGLHFEMAYLILGEDKNPQIATVFLFMLTTGLLSSLAAFKRTRSMDRMFVAIACVSMLLTGLAFHYVLIQKTLPAWAKDAAWANSFLVTVPASDFLEKCEEAGYDCWHGTEDVPLVLNDVNPAFRQNVAGIHAFYDEHRPEHTAGHGFGSFNDLEQDGVSVVLYFRDGEDTRVISDPHAGLRVHSVIRDGFYLLSTIAHVVWLSGALFLLWFHQRRFKRRIPC